MNNDDERDYAEEAFNRTLLSDERDWCEVDDCELPAVPCSCGNAHCAGHPHVMITAYPPGTPVITNSRESYPAVVLQPPAAVAGHRVLAWAETRRRDGEYPGGVVLAVSNPEHERHEYATWYAYTKDGGQTWGAESGHYWTDYGNAWDDFADRATHHPATEY